MLFCKLLGALFAISAGVCGAVLLNREADRRIDEVEAWIALLRLTKNQIDCFSLPQREILARCDEGLLRRLGWTGNKPPEEFSALGSSLRESRLTEEGERIARGFTEEIGKGYRAEQLHTCDYAIGLFCAERDRLLSQLGGARKRNTTLCLCGAVALAIVLL